MNRRWRFLLPLAIAAGIARADEAPSVRPVLTLEQAVSTALASNRRVAAAQLEVAQAKERLAKAKTSRMPTLEAEGLVSQLVTSADFEFEKGAFGTYPGVGPIPAEPTKVSAERGLTTAVDLRISQPLTQLYKIDLGVKSRALAVEAAGEDARATRRDVVGAVRAAYYGALRAKASLAAAEEAERLAIEVERVASEAVSLEAALPGELMDAKARRARAEADVLTLRDALETQKELLNAYMARPLDAAFDVADVPETVPGEPELEASRREARSSKPSVRKARLGASLADIDVRLAKAEYIPEAGLAIGYVSIWGSDFLPKNVVTAGVSVKWEVFDGGRRAKETAEKRHAAEEARLEAREAEEMAAVEVARDVRRVAETHRLLEAARLSRSAARERLRVAQNQYGAHAALLSDLLHAETRFADANREESDALLSYWTARADYEKSHGENP